MKKIFILIIWLISTLILVCGCSEEGNIKDKVYETFFADINMVVIFKINPSTLEIYREEFDEQDVALLQKELKNMEYVKEFVADVSVVGFVKEGYHSLCFNQKHKKIAYTLLYSTAERSILVRKRDIFSDVHPQFPNEPAYEFKISQKAVDIIKKYEEKFPENTKFYGEWAGPSKL